MYNFRVLGNYLFCDMEPVGDELNPVAEGLRKNVEIRLVNHTANPQISVNGLNNWSPLLSVPLSNITVEGVAMNLSAFLTWSTTNTGNFNSPNGGATSASELTVTPSVNGLTNTQAVLTDHEARIDTLESATPTAIDLTYARVNASTDLASTVYTNANNGVKIPFNNIKYNSGIAITGTDVMTPSVTGRYRVSWLMQAGSGEFAGDGYFVVMQNGVFIDRVRYDMMQAAGVNQSAGFIDIDLTANLPVELRYQAASDTDTIVWQVGSYFQLDQLPEKIVTVVDGNTPTVDQTSLNYFDIGNMRIQWGNHNDGNVDTTTVTLPIAFPNTNYSVVVTSNTSAGSLSAEARTTNTFDIDRSSTTTTTQDYSWIAMGSKV